MTQFELFFHFLSPSHRPRFNKHVNETEKSFEVNYKHEAWHKSEVMQEHEIWSIPKRAQNWIAVAGKSRRRPQVRGF